VTARSNLRSVSSLSERPWLSATGTGAEVSAQRSDCPGVLMRWCAALCSEAHTRIGTVFALSRLAVWAPRNVVPV